MQELKDNSLFTEGEEYIQIVLKKTEWIELLEKEKEQLQELKDKIESLQYELKEERDY